MKDKHISELAFAPYKLLQKIKKSFWTVNCGSSTINLYYRQTHKVANHTVVIFVSLLNSLVGKTESVGLKCLD